MSSLPSNWVVAPLGDLLTDVLGGGTPDKSKAENFRGDIPFMTVKDMHSRFIDDTQDHISQEALASSASRVIPADTLVIASRMSLGKIARPTRAVAINQDLKALLLHQDVSKSYIEYAWRANASRIQAMGTGTTVKGIRLEDIRGLQVPVAPAAEQTRIADQLDTLLARIQACRDRLDAIPALLKRFRQAVVGAAATGELTAAWRQGLTGPTSEESEAEPGSSNGLPARWQLLPLKDIVDCFDNVRVPIRASDRAKRRGPFPYFGAFGEIDSIDGYLFDGEYLLLAEDGKNLESRDRPIALIATGKFWVNNHAHVLRPRAGVNIRFLLHWLNSTQCDLSDLLTGIDQIKLTRGSMDRIPVPLPPASEQGEIVRRIDALLGFADRIEARHLAAVAQARRLAPLTLSKAFRGELVPQDPSDEPASTLLERIAAQRNAPRNSATTRTPRRGRPPRSPKESAAMTKSRQDDDVMGQPYLAGHLRRIGTPASAEALFKLAELPVADFYKQLAWEVAQGHVKDNQTTLEPGHAAG